MKKSFTALHNGAFFNVSDVTKARGSQTYKVVTALVYAAQEDTVLTEVPSYNPLQFYKKKCDWIGDASIQATRADVLNYLFNYSMSSEVEVYIDTQVPKNTIQVYNGNTFTLTRDSNLKRYVLLDMQKHVQHIYAYDNLAQQQYQENKIYEFLMKIWE